MRLRALFCFVVTLLLVLFGACYRAPSCETSADCPGEAVCDPEKFCVQKTRGETDGGDDADLDGGQSTPCVEGCQAWQTCRPTSISNGECVNATITALRPANGAHFTGGNPATFVFEVTQWDGGMWPGDVPFSVGEGMTGPTLLSKKTITFEADVTLASTAGFQTVVAGWPAVDAGVTVVVEKCAVDCRPWQECVPDAANGTCRDLGLTLAFTAPSVGFEYGPINSARVSLLLTATRVDGGPFAAPIPFGLSNDAMVLAWGQLERADKEWAGSVDAGADDGARTLFAGWDGGPGTTTTFKVTATPPTITLMPEMAPRRPESQTDVGGLSRWKKSEVAPVRVVSSRDLLAPPTPADFANTSVAASARCTACAAPRCYCFEVDLATQSFTQAAPGTLYGTVPVSLSKPLRDVLGNSGTAESAAFDVTRLKWSQVVASLAAATPTALAITPSGGVVAGATLGTTSTLTALDPDGGIAWQKSYGSEAITSGPMVGQMGIYFAVSTGSEGRLRKLEFDGVRATDECIFGGLSYPGDMSLVSPGRSEFPVAVARNTASGSAKLMGNDSSASNEFATLSSGARPTIVVNGAQAYVAASSWAPIWRFDELTAKPTPQGTRSTIELFPSNLFLVGTTLVGGGGGGPTVGGVFAFYDVGDTLDGGATVNVTPSASPGGPAVVGPPDAGDAGPWVYYGDSGGNLRRARLASVNPPSFDSLLESLVVGDGDFSQTSPLIGANNQLYVAGGNVLHVVDATAASSGWHWTAPDAISVQLNLDKNRDATHPCALGQPGVLYVVTAGTQTTVYAILVDSPGIDGSAPWPRYQHDPANTGNPATGLASWACE